MTQPLIRRLLIVMRVTVALLCMLTIPASQAHTGNHADESDETDVKGGDFTLTSDKGPVALSDFRGKVVVIYFGYTHCTDVCPDTLGKLGSALKSMKPEEVAQIQPLFITVDPARDNAQLMAEYCENFHPKLIGLTGTEAEIAAVAKAYRVRSEKGPINADGGYDMGHPSVIYLVGRHGEVLLDLSHNASPARIEAVLRMALKSS